MLQSGPTKHFQSCIMSCNINATSILHQNSYPNQLGFCGQSTGAVGRCPEIAQKAIEEADVTCRNMHVISKLQPFSFCSKHWSRQNSFQVGRLPTSLFLARKSWYGSKFGEREREYLQKHANGQSSSVYKKRQIQRYDNVVISTLNDLSNKNLSMMCFITLPYGIVCLSNGVHSEGFGERINTYFRQGKWYVG